MINQQYKSKIKPLSILEIVLCAIVLIIAGLMLKYGISFAKAAIQIKAKETNIATYEDNMINLDEINSGRFTYYFDSSSASSYEDGSIEHPYKDISRISLMTFGPGDRVLLKRGTAYSGTLFVQNSRGKKDDIIYFGSYGEGSRPKINGNDIDGGGVLHIYNCEYITVEGYELFDTGVVEKDKRGVLIEGDNAGILSGITVRNMYIHHIKGYTDSANNGMSTDSKSTGGIQVWVRNADITPTRFDSLTIEKNIINNVDNAGIATWHTRSTQVSIQPGTQGWENIAYTNLRIAENVISNVGKNAIVIRSAEGGVVEYNTVYETALRCISGNQIFTRDCRGTVIQYNEGFLNRMLPDSTGVFRDGSMLDPDLRSPNTIWQYNYSHDNAFGLMTTCTDVNDDNIIVRYNVSAGDKSWLLNINYDVSGIWFYNNTFFIPEGYEGVSVIRERDKEMDSRNSNQVYYYYNNLVYNMGINTRLAMVDIDHPTAPSSIKNTIKRTFSNNLFYSAEGKDIINIEYLYVPGHFNEDTILDSNFLQSDPLFVQMPDVNDDLHDRIGRQYADRFMLKPGSPAIGAGKVLENIGEFDFYGNSLDADNPNIGAYGGKGVSDIEITNPDQPLFPPHSNRGPAHTSNRYFTVQGGQTDINQPDKSFANEHSWFVKKNEKETYLKYKLLYSENFENITLNLYIKDFTKGAQLKLYGLKDNEWFGDTLTYNNKPDESLRSLIATFNANRKGWVSIDITEYAQRELFYDTVLSFVIVSENDDMAEIELGAYEDIDPNDNSVYTSPYVDIVYKQLEGTYYPIYNQHVGDGSRANDNYSTGDSMHVKRGSSGFSRYTYMLFDLSEEKREVITATLRLHVNIAEGVRPSAPASVVAYAISFSDWDNNITYNTLPNELKAINNTNKLELPPNAVMLSRVTITGTTTSEGQKGYDFDITNYVKSLTDEKRFTIMLLMESSNAGSDYIGFMTTRSADTTRHPMIYINEPVSEPPTGYFKVTAKLDNIYGTVSPQFIDCARGATAEFTVTPYPGYIVDYVKINGINAFLDGDKIIIDNVTSDTIVNVAFKEKAKGDLILPSEDSYIRDGNYKDNNFGNASLLEAKTATGGGNTRIIYVKFPINDLNSAATKIEFNLYAYQRTGMNSGYRFKLALWGFYESEESVWSENEISWINAPYLEQIIGTSARQPDLIFENTAKGWIMYDVTQLIKTRPEGVKYITFALMDYEVEPGLPMLRLYSKETDQKIGENELKPHLYVYTEPVYNIELIYDKEKGFVDYISDSIVSNMAFSALILPNAGYKVGVVTINNQEVLLDGLYLNINQVKGDLRIVIPFVKYYSVNVTTDNNGFTTTGSQIVNEGDYTYINLVPNAGYLVKYIYINGELTDIKETYFKLENITERTDVFVIFEKGVNIKVEVNGKGTASVNDELILPGASKTIIFYPDKGYYVSKVLVNGEEVDVINNNITLNEINSDTVINVEFAIIKQSSVPYWIWLIIGSGVVIIVGGVLATIIIKKKKN
ncbi:MAG: DNRLRE domain-containing protein [Clostridiales bacterium]|nr:DNRLRE domain-containing protein [Clostridiales bacterium]